MKMHTFHFFFHRENKNPDLFFRRKSLARKCFEFRGKLFFSISVTMTRFDLELIIQVPSPFSFPYILIWNSAILFPFLLHFTPIFIYFGNRIRTILAPAPKMFKFFRIKKIFFENKSLIFSASVWLKISKPV